MTPQRTEEKRTASKQKGSRPLRACERLGWDPGASGVEIIGRTEHRKPGYYIATQS